MNKDLNWNRLPDGRIRWLLERKLRTILDTIVMNLDKMAEDEIRAIKETYKIRRKKMA